MAQDRIALGRRSPLREQRLHLLDRRMLSERIDCRAADEWIGIGEGRTHQGELVVAERIRAELRELA
jgi:hypothetical protein